MNTRLLTIAFTMTLAAFAQSDAHGQTVETSRSWETPYGSNGQENSAFQVGAAGRDENGNRVIIDGLMQTGVGTNTQRNSGNGSLFGGGVGSSATAIGNQLNVTVVGNWNTVIVNSIQTNNGDINATSQSSVPDDENE